MAKTAILVDGGFYRRRARALWGELDPSERADELYDYALKHITLKKDARIELDRRELYRVFYYDCPPVQRASVYHPLLMRNVDFKRTDEAYRWSDEFLRALGAKRKVALRLGEVITDNAAYVMKSDVTKKLLKRQIELGDLRREDFSVTFKQGGVDMRIGLDIASLVYGGIVSQIVLVTGDSDFVPAAKLARRFGVDFLVDPMGQHVRDDLVLHADGIESFVRDDRV